MHFLEKKMGKRNAKGSSTDSPIKQGRLAGEAFLEKVKAEWERKAPTLSRIPAGGLRLWGEKLPSGETRQYAAEYVHKRMSAIVGDRHWLFDQGNSVRVFDH
jgi:hypothetical protein